MRCIFVKIHSTWYTASGLYSLLFVPLTPPIKGTIGKHVILSLFALIVSICGIQFGIVLFVPFIIAIILMMGFDKITAALVTVGGIMAGIIGTTYAPNNTGILTSTLALDFDFAIGIRWIILVVAIALVIFNVLMYVGFKKTSKAAKKGVKEEKKEEVVVKKEVKKAPAKKAPAKKTTAKKTTSKKTTSKTRKSANKAALIEEDVIMVPAKVNGKHKIWPLVLTFSLLFVVFMLAFIPWASFKVESFNEFSQSVQQFTIFKFPIFAKILGIFNPFGSWSITDLILPMALVILVLSLIYKVKLDDLFDGFIEGAKKALAPAVLVILIYSILVLTTYHPFQLVIYKSILGLSKGFNIATTVLVALLAPIFNSDIAYSFQSVVPYFASIVTKTENYPVAAVIFQSMYGLVMLVAPTSVVLMGILSYLKVSYKEWLKTIWKLLLELFVVLLIIFIILALI